MYQSALETYLQVANLVQKGQLDQARDLAVTIPVDHLRWMALLLANYSRSPQAQGRSVDGLEPGKVVR